MTRQHKTFSFHVKASDDELGTIEAYGSVFDVPDYGDDIVRPGAFKRTIQHAKSRIESGKARFLAVMLYQHDPDRPIGGWTDLQEDDNGLKCKGRIVLETQLGRETYALIKAGVIDQFSIGYDVPSGGSTYDKSSGYRELKELRLWEISPVTFAMQPEALLTGVKDNNMNQEQKAGRSISAANQERIQGHANAMRAFADKMLADATMHHKAMHSVADDLATLLQGSEAAYGADAGTPDAGQQEGKSASSPSETRAAAPHPSFEDTADEAGLSALLDVLRSANSSN